VQPGDRIAQLVVAPVVRVRIDAVDDVAALGQTARGEGGFGSTGGIGSAR
jgi:dUTP pyrophosphatase